MIHIRRENALLNPRAQNNEAVGERVMIPPSSESLLQVHLGLGQNASRS